MKKNGILNSELSRVVAQMGHTDKLVICDSGLPIPRNAEVIDLALSTNLPRFIETLKVILEELQIEEAIVAEEMLDVSCSVFDEVISLLPKVKIQKVPHEEFKKITKNPEGNIAFVRTGEATPYANIILISGVTFN
ncbi:MAG: D-ribose pyranase [Syntrophothermus sp.]